MPVVEWDEPVTRQYVEALESRIDELEKAMIGLGDILRDMKHLDGMVISRLKQLERIIEERTGGD
jgi:hypothetical protein